MKSYVTFGQTHIHLIDGETFDKDCVAVVEGGREKVWDAFSASFSRWYSEDDWNEESLKYYPRGYIEVYTERNSD